MSKPRDRNQGGLKGLGACRSLIGYMRMGGTGAWYGASSWEDARAWDVEGVWVWEVTARQEHGRVQATGRDRDLEGCMGVGGDS